MIQILRDNRQIVLGFDRSSRQLLNWRNTYRPQEVLAAASVRL